MGKSKLHELLAVEADLSGTSTKIMNETRKVFKEKDVVFKGMVRTYTPFVEDGIDYPTERIDLTTTVYDKLYYMSKSVIKYYDAILQKEATNQLAVADLVVEGEVIATALPATFLLGMETRLRTLREVYAQIPTLDIGIDWVKDASRGENIFTTVHPEEVMKTQKTTRSTVLYEAKFPKANEGGNSQPAVIDRWDETENIGKYVKRHWSGAITAARKSDLLAKVDVLITSVKKARQRANSTEVSKAQIGQKIFDFINK